MYIYINNLENIDKLDKVIFTRTYLKELAFNQFKLYMQDFQDNLNLDN